MIQQHEGEVWVSFVSKWTVPYGKAVYVVGSCPELGKWQIAKSVRLRYLDNNIWWACLPIHKPCLQYLIEYKMFAADYQNPCKDEALWENHNDNRIISLHQRLNAYPNMTVCSFNIRYENSEDKGSISWSNRKKRVVDFLSDRQYDIVGVQQATMPQRIFMQEHLTNYEYYGRPRDLHHGEECGIFVNSQKFTVIEDQYHWISQSRVQGSVGYDAKFPRCYTLLLVTPKIVQIKQNKLQCFLIINLHLDHMGVNARLEGVKQALQSCIDFNKKMSTDKSMILVGCLIMGDFNVSEGNSVFDVLKSNEMKFESLRDLKNADKSFTFNGFQNKFLLKIGSIIVNNQLTIDHMYFWAPPASPVKPLLFEVEKDNSDEFMSDHYPIIATFGANV